ncbi:MAG TPA: hypothetical protein VN259_09835 [Xanthomonadales bacterium]|nr:hypothetical protein [Xanthomonadales bacterium]
MFQTSESLSFAMARRTLMQRFDGDVDESEAAQDVAARQLLARASSLADDGAHTERSQVTQALISQQLAVAQDVSELWPHAPAMQIAAAQMASKARAFEAGGHEASAHHETRSVRAHREAG